MALDDLAEFLWLEGDADTSRKLYEESLPVFEGLGDQSAVAHAQRGLARCMAVQGDIEKASVLFERSLATHRLLDNPNAVANTLHHIGQLHLQLGEYDDAERHLETSLQAFRVMAERNGTALVLAALAEVALARGDHRSAETFYQEGLTIAREIGNGRLEADVIAGLGDLKLLTGEMRVAEQLFIETLDMSERLKYAQGVAYARQRQGYLAYSRGDYEEASLRFEESFTLYRDNQLWRGRAAVLTGLGRTAGYRDPSKAAKYFRDALVTTLKRRTDAVTLNVLVDIAAFLIKRSRKEQALRCLALSLHHFAATYETRFKAEKLGPVLFPGVPGYGLDKAVEENAALLLIETASEAIDMLEVLPLVPQ